MKKILMFVLLGLLILPSACMARPLPNSEFCLGGISVLETPLNEVRRIYGEPTLVQRKSYGNAYRYGDSVYFETNRYGNQEHVRYIVVSGRNGWGTPAGLTVGMKKSTMIELYGYEQPIYNRETGYYDYMYPHKGTGAGAGMKVEVNRYDVICRISVID